MINFENSVTTVEDWLHRSEKRVFGTLYFHSKSGFVISETGNFCIFPEHKNFDEGNITVCPPEGPVSHKMHVVIDNAEDIAKITTNEVVDGFVVWLRTGDKIGVYGGA
jgi:hypothetical protein